MRTHLRAKAGAEWLYVQLCLDPAGPGTRYASEVGVAPLPGAQAGSLTHGTVHIREDISGHFLLPLVGKEGAKGVSL